MKKFSNIPETEKIVKKTEINTLLEKALSNLELKINADADNYINKKLEISGKDVLVEKIKSLIKTIKTETRENVFESIKKQSSDFFDVNKINEAMFFVNNRMDSLVTIPSANQVFDTSDYSKENDEIVLNKLEKMPEKYLDYLNKEVSNRFFDNGNFIKISESWKLDFVPANNYSFDKSGGAITTPDYKRFMLENKEFIADFIKATQMLIGSKNLKFNNQLLNFSK